MPANFNDSTPAAPSGKINVAWQKDGSENISANVAEATSSTLGVVKPDNSTVTVSAGVLSATGSGGTVTSVALTVPAEFSVSGSPVTTTGTLAITKATESANTVWAGPTSGGAAQPTFRALVAADIPASVTPNFADNETPSGTINSINVTFGLAHTPNASASLMLYQNGVLAIQGTDYTLATATITMTTAPTTGAILKAFYRY